MASPVIKACLGGYVVMPLVLPSSIRYSVEEFLEGKFRKFNNIFGDVERPPLPGEDQAPTEPMAANGA